MPTLKSRDPANDEVIGEVPVASVTDVRDAVAAAKAAQPAWAAQGAEERAKRMLRFRDLLLAQRDEVARLITRESGKPLIESHMVDILSTLETAKHLGRHGVEELRPRKVRLHNVLLYDRRSTVHRRPLGVVAVIAPWNYPLALASTGVLTALFAGNAVVFKPSTETPLVGKWIVDALRESGVPEDVVSCVQGDGATVGNALVESPDTDGVLFTGSVPVGRKVASGCASRFKPNILELGGKDPMVVLPKARFDLTVAGALWGAFTNAGQTCAAVERLYVPRAQEEAYVKALAEKAAGLRLGHGLEKGTQMGPVINDRAVETVLGQIKDAERKGATVEAGGHIRDDLGPRFIEPTILSGVDHTMTCMTEETFGPHLPIMAYDTLDEAVALANDSEFGLSASVWGPTREAEAVAARIQAGTVTVNDCLYTYAAPETPWGGWKHSGIGASHGRWGLEDVTHWQHIGTSPAGRARSPWYYPYDETLESFIDAGLRFLHGGAAGAASGPRAIWEWKKRL